MKQFYIIPTPYTAEDSTADLLLTIADIIEGGADLLEHEFGKDELTGQYYKQLPKRCTRHRSQTMKIYRQIGKSIKAIRQTANSIRNENE